MNFMHIYECCESKREVLASLREMNYLYLLNFQQKLGAITVLVKFLSDHLE